MTDARFEDGDDQPLRLLVEDEQDLEILSSLVQDAVFPANEMAWTRQRREFAILINRFRWEDRTAAQAGQRGYERVQSVLQISDVQKVSSQGIDRADSETILSLLSIAFEPGEDGAGTVLLTLAGDGAVRCAVECLNLTLRDVTRPYLAPSGKAPEHAD